MKINMLIFYHSGWSGLSANIHIFKVKLSGMNILRSNIFIFLAAINTVLTAQTADRTGKLKRPDCFFGVHFDLHASEDITDAGRTLTYSMVDTFLTRVNPDFIQIDCK